MVYRTFSDLAAENTLGIDYDIRNRYGAGNYVIHLAVHGGALEPPTSQLASYCSSTGGGFYTFEALREISAASLALDPVGFDEPFGVVNTANSARTVSWHGVEDQRHGEEVTYVSGLDTVLVTLVKNELTAAGFVVDTPPIRFAGDDPRNITNRNRMRGGVQLDLTRSLRAAFYAGGDLSQGSVTNPDNRMPAFFAYGDAVRRACAQVPQTPASEPETAPVIRAFGPREEAVSTAMRTPFAIDHSGGVAATTDPREQLLDRVHALVGTLPGERVMRATYGVPTSAALFEVDADAAYDQLQRAVREAVAAFEPSAVVSDITANLNRELGMVDISVQVSRADVPGAERDVTRAVGVTIGGTVVSTPQ